MKVWEKQKYNYWINKCLYFLSLSLSIYIKYICMYVCVYIYIYMNRRESPGQVTILSHSPQQLNHYCSYEQARGLHVKNKQCHSKLF